MKKTCLFLFIAFGAAYLTNGQTSGNNDLAKLNLNGKVKIIKQRFFDAVTDNGTYRKGNSNSGEGSNYENIDTEFDTDGNIKVVSRLRFQDLSLVEKDVYKYENGRLVEIVTQSAKGDITRKRSFVYDANGNKSTESYLIRVNAKPLITKFTYTKAGQLEKVLDYGGSYTEYKYDENGRVSEKKEKIDDINWLTKFIYNANGKPARTEKYRNKKIFEMVNYTYDDNGKQLTPKPAFLFEELDNQGNWTKRVFNSHGTNFFTERTFEYFE